MGARVFEGGTPRMLSVALHVGRLLEVRASGELSLGEFAEFRTAFTLCLAQANTRVLVACDLRKLGPVQRPEVGQAMVRLMHLDNALVDRAAYLLAREGRMADILEERVRAGNNPARQAFREPVAVVGHLRASATPAELHQLAAFLG